jgi:hypothetical protein
MRFAWNAAPFLNKSGSENINAYLLDWSRREFGESLTPDVAAIYAGYFNIPYQRDDQRLGDNDLHTPLRKLHEKAAQMVAVGKPLTKEVRDKAADIVKFASQNRPYVAELARKAESLSARIPADRKQFYQAHVLTPIGIHLHSLEMLESYGKSLAAYDAGERPQSIALVEKSLRAIDGVFAALHQAEYGRWSGWYIGERFVGVEANRDRLRVLLAVLRGQSPPPQHPPFDYEDLYEYQVPFGNNFPLLYPAK